MANKSSTKNRSTAGDNQNSNESPAVELLTIKQYVQRRRLKPHEAGIIANYIRMNEGEGFPSLAKRPISKWDKTYKNMLNEKV